MAIIMILIPVTAFLYWFVCCYNTGPRSVRRQPLTWAQQRRADRIAWSGMQREAMEVWEAACQCPEPRVFLDYRTGQPLDDPRAMVRSVMLQHMLPTGMPAPGDMYAPMMGPRAPRRDAYLEALARENDRLHRQVRVNYGTYQRYEA